jgi:hypothetical protein
MRETIGITDNDDFQMSGPQYPIHYTPQGTSGVLDIVLHKYVRLSDVSVCGILDSDQLPTFLHIMDHARARDVSNLLILSPFPYDFFEASDFFFLLVDPLDIS